MSNRISETLFQPLELPCGTVLKNRIVKSAMSDSLGDGRGNPTDAQIRLYQRWADGGVAAMIIGESGNIARFASKHHFASYNATAPVEASSGPKIRHRLSQRGNRN